MPRSTDADSGCLNSNGGRQHPAAASVWQPVSRGSRESGSQDVQQTLATEQIARVKVRGVWRLKHWAVKMLLEMLGTAVLRDICVLSVRHCTARNLPLHPPPEGNALVILCALAEPFVHSRQSAVTEGVGPGG